MFSWLFAKRKKSDSVRPELIMRATIADKLKQYNADEDTTISEFSLADDGPRKKTAPMLTPAGKGDVWGQANPSESGIWKKENRRKRSN